MTDSLDKIRLKGSAHQFKRGPGPRGAARLQQRVHRLALEAARLARRPDRDEQRYGARLWQTLLRFLEDGMTGQRVRTLSEHVRRPFGQTHPSLEGCLSEAGPFVGARKRNECRGASMRARRARRPRQTVPDVVRDETVTVPAGDTGYWLLMDDATVEVLATGVCPALVARQCWEMLEWKREHYRQDARAVADTRSA